MTRLLGLLSACVLAGATALSAQSTPARPPARGAGGGQAGNPPATGRATTPTPNREELQRLRADLKRDQDEAKRLDTAIKQDKKAGDRDAVRRDTEALKKTRKDIKKDQAEIKQLQQRGRGRSAGAGA